VSIMRRRAKLAILLPRRGTRVVVVLLLLPLAKALMPPCSSRGMMCLRRIKEVVLLRSTAGAHTMRDARTVSTLRAATCRRSIAPLLLMLVPVLIRFCGGQYETCALAHDFERR
jgi:hypothetical protein